MRFVRSTLVWGAFVVALASNAAADGPSAADLKKRGDAAMQDLHYREALESYDLAYAITHDPAILYNRARALQALGNYPTALDAIEEFVRVAPDELKQRVPKLADLVADIRDHVGLVVVESPVAGSTVSVQGGVMGTTPLPAPLRISAGTAMITVEARGYVTFRKEVNVVGGKLMTVAATMNPEVVVVVHETTPQPTVSAQTYVPQGWRIATYAFGALGLGGLAVGATFGALVAARKGDINAGCPSKVCDAKGWSALSDANTFATISTISFIVGGVCAGAFVALLALSPHKPRPMAIVPLVGPGFAGAGGSF